MQRLRRGLPPMPSVTKIKATTMPRPDTKRRYWTCMKLITRTHRYTIHSSGSQVAPIAA
jgi:hypothetical protein